MDPVELANILRFLGLVVIFAPLLMLSLIGLPTLFGWKLTEGTIAHTCKLLVALGLMALLGILGIMLATGRRHVPIEFGNLVNIQSEHFHFHLKFEFDRLSVPMAILSFVLCGTIGAFANIYLHRDLGYRRFFIFFSLFLVGMTFASLSGTIETLFVGWEMVGLSSALLVAYFHDRPSPVRNGQRIWAIYRFADAAFLAAAVTLHHLTGEGDFSGLMGVDPWPLGKVSLTEGQALSVGLLLLVAAAGKSALVPFSGWLPRAMEGPTPSSAVFYGALSVHLGAFLLLRVSPLLEASRTLSLIVFALGLTTAIYAAWTGRVQTDVKSSLAMASLTQVGIIVAEIGLGLRYIALIHMIGHACLRTLQLLRAPTLLRDYRTLENAIGARLRHTPAPMMLSLPASWQTRLYRFFLERGHLDSLLDHLIVTPFLRSFRQFDRWERRWTDFLSGKQSRESDLLVPQAERIEDLV
ncbi:MAG: proton-conducting transporter membrane subunit [Pirellulales bacterium]